MADAVAFSSQAFSAETFCHGGFGKVGAEQLAIRKRSRVKLVLSALVHARLSLLIFTQARSCSENTVFISGELMLCSLARLKCSGFSGSAVWNLMCVKRSSELHFSTVMVP